ncbi:hypothetical protein [Planktothrix prolifica]|uniref:hypothetical protein n=1 Tax=Planktothrix prolifica TaxID=54307 RepID=UPI00130DEC43|nr:hypothetical protein [Planktothrix prolifica]
MTVNRIIGVVWVRTLGVDATFHRSQGLEYSLYFVSILGNWNINGDIAALRL